MLQSPAFLIDFHFASMVGVLLLPDAYAGRVLGPETKQFAIRAAAQAAAEAGRIKATPAGQFVLRMYEKYRLA